MGFEMKIDYNISWNDLYMLFIKIGNKKIVKKLMLDLKEYKRFQKRISIFKKKILNRRENVWCV